MLSKTSIMLMTCLLVLFVAVVHLARDVKVVIPIFWHLDAGSATTQLSTTQNTIEQEGGVIKYTSACVVGTPDVDAGKMLFKFDHMGSDNCLPKPDAGTRIWCVFPF